MIDRLDLYDVLSTIVPGALLVTGGATLFSNLKGPFIAAGLPSEFAFVALVSGAVIAGQVVQTIGSTLEPLLFRLFGGRPSDLAVSGRLAARYLPGDASKRIVEKLRTRCGSTDASSHGLFLYAMNMAECSSNAKARAFNAQFGHLRALFTTAVLVLGMLTVSRYVGDALSWRSSSYWTVIGLDAVLVLLFAWRTWQRGAYFAREVLLTAERQMDSTTPLPTANLPATE